MTMRTFIYWNQEVLLDLLSFCFYTTKPPIRNAVVVNVMLFTVLQIAKYSKDKTGVEPLIY